jgi:hypothetical protein
MLIAFLAGGLLAAAPLDAPHAAVLAVLSRGDTAAGCRDDQRLKLARDAKIQQLGRVGGDDVVMAWVYDPCICGAQNCPFYVIRLSPGNPRVLIDGYGIDERTTDHAKPLPGIVARMHDSAAIAVESRWAYRGDKYVMTDASRLRWQDNARKPAGGVPVRFAPGASSASLHGKASLGWYDDYSFAANAGQKLLIDNINSRAKTSLTLYGPDNTPLQGLRPGVPLTLPRTGTYHIWIENDSETDVPYTLRLAIR